MKQTISVIIPVFNRARLVVRTLESVAAQTRQPERLIVVDNNSSDDSFAVVREWMKSYKGSAECILLTEKTPGAAAARNCGLDAADTKIICFFDSDDTMRPSLLESIGKAFGSDSAIQLVHWNAILHPLKGSPRPMKYTREINLHSQIFHSSLRTQGYAAKRDLIEKAGRWDESIRVWDDWELGIRLLLESPKMVSLGSEYADIYSQEESITGTSFHSRSRECELAIECAEADISDSSHPDKARLLRLLSLRRAILAGLYRQEGFRHDAKRLLHETLSSAPDKRTVLACRIAFTHTSAGLRGAAVYANLL